MASSSKRPAETEELAEPEELSPEEIISNTPCNVCDRLIADWKYVHCTFVTPSMSTYNCECTNYAHWDCIEKGGRRTWCCAACTEQFVSKNGTDVYAREILRQGGCVDRFREGMTCKIASQIRHTHARKRRRVVLEPCSQTSRTRPTMVSVETQTECAC